jgi:hypothetical protein
MKKFIIVMHLVLSLIVIGFNVHSYSPVVQANGSELTPVTESGVLTGMTPDSGFRLMGRSGLIALAEFVNAGNGASTSGVYFVLHNEGNVDGSGLFPIGHRSSTDPNTTSFQGIFNGSGVVIENLSITAYDNKNGLGLFGRVFNATIENIIVSGLSIDGTSRDHIGSIAGFSEQSTISGVQVLGNIMINGRIILGGFVGEAFKSTIVNSFVSAINLNITGVLELGGFVGKNKLSQISNSYVNASNIEISGNGDALGGFVGWNESSTISNSYLSASGLVVSGTYLIGGFVGYNQGSTISNSYVNPSSLELIGNSWIGGFVGWNESSTISNSYLSASGLVVSGTYLIGGFVGYNQGSTISNSYVNPSSLELIGNSWIGGFVGENRNASITSSYVSASGLVVSGTSSLGGFVGKNDGSSEINNTFLATSTLQVIGNTDSGLFFGQ